MNQQPSAPAQVSPAAALSTIGGLALIYCGLMFVFAALFSSLI